jgi:hypothetical protein
LIFLNVQPSMENIRAASRYPALLKRVGLV